MISYRKTILQSSSNSFSYEYWNDPEEEKRKVWSSWKADFDKFIKNDQLVSLRNQFEILLKNSGLNLNGKKVLSLGSGVCALECSIIKSHPELQEITCLEFSRHRIHEDAPLLAEKFNIPTNQIEFILGSFYNLTSFARKYDFIVLSQAFHHANDPDKLLSEIKSAIKPDGKIIIMAEHYFNRRTITLKILKHFVKFILNHKGYRNRSPLIPRWRTLFPIDVVKGDHHYTFSQYKDMFKRHGYNYKRFIFQKYLHQAFILSWDSDL